MLLEFPVDTEAQRTCSVKQVGKDEVLIQMQVVLRDQILNLLTTFGQGH